MTAEDRVLLGAIAAAQARTERALQLVLEELAHVRAELARQARGRRSRDQADDRRLLTAIAAVVADRSFSAVELFDLARVDPELATTLEAAGALEARALGAVLRRLRDQVTGAGYVLRALGRDAAGMIWRMYVDDSHTGSSATRRRPA